MQWVTSEFTGYVPCFLPDFSPPFSSYIFNSWLQYPTPFTINTFYMHRLSSDDINKQHGMGVPGVLDSPCSLCCSLSCVLLQPFF